MREGVVNSSIRKFLSFGIMWSGVLLSGVALSAPFAAGELMTSDVAQTLLVVGVIAAFLGRSLMLNPITAHLEVGLWFTVWGIVGLCGHAMFAYAGEHWGAKPSAINLAYIAPWALSLLVGFGLILRSRRDRPGKHKALR